jgi:hypothetical protein
MVLETSRHGFLPRQFRKVFSLHAPAVIDEAGFRQCMVFERGFDGTAQGVEAVGSDRGW